MMFAKRLAVFVVLYFAALSQPINAQDREVVIPVPQSAYSQAVKVKGGTLVFLSGADTPTATALLPDTHIAVVRADRIVSGMEEAFALIRAERATMPRAVNMISGPSRTGDIEQTIVLGAHGPYRVHLLLLG